MRKLLTKEEEVIIAKLTAVDYAAIERRVREAMEAEDGGDPHSEAAALALGIPFESVTPAQRLIGKSLNYGLVYTWNLRGEDRAATIRGLMGKGYTLTGRGRKRGMPV